jgi:hypothetical protein
MSVLGAQPVLPSIDTVTALPTLTVSPTRQTGVNTGG